MTDHYDPAETAFLRRLEYSRRGSLGPRPHRTPQPRIRAWTAETGKPVLDLTASRTTITTTYFPKRKPPPQETPVANVHAKSLKCTIVIDPAEILGITLRENAPRLVLVVQLPDRQVRIDLACKSVRRAQATIRELGVDGVACFVQGMLGGGDTLLDAGLAAQPKKPKQEAAAPAPAVAA
jgi:hypothetical protein